MRGSSRNHAWQLTQPCAATHATLRGNSRNHSRQLNGWQSEAMRIEVVSGDITQQHVDAVVNAANRAMRGGGGVDGAIHRAGGPVILEDCIARFPDGLATGDAGWTTAGDLPARWVIHVVGPNYAAGQTDRTLLTSCYARALAIADELGARTLAFPLVSAGIYGWPLDDAAAAAVETLRTTSTSASEARLVAFGDAAYDALQAAHEG
jgi:O-acetyl-ADP-ribose deacetylase (regulator of RNase III)